MTNGGDEISSPMRILVVEDDKFIARYIKKGLQDQHFEVDLISDGLEAQNIAVRSVYDLVILDVGLPGIDGFQVLRSIRVSRPNVPIIMLTGYDSTADRVRGLDGGADDYVVKPFSITEVSARIRVLLRRGDRLNSSILRIQDLEVNLGTRVVTRTGKRIDLSSREYSLLVYLMQNAGRCVTRAMIMQDVWTLAFDTPTNVVDVYINYLRAKIDKDHKKKLIKTMRGIGYQLDRRTVSEEDELSTGAD